MPDLPGYILFFIGLLLGLLGSVLAIGITGGRRQFDDSDLQAAYYEGYTDRGDLDVSTPGKVVEVKR